MEKFNWKKCKRIEICFMQHHPKRIRNEVFSISVYIILTNHFRNWINRNFVEIKKNNPNLLFIVRECENADSNIIARYGNY